MTTEHRSSDPNPDIEPSAASVVRRYLEAFLSGDIETAWSMVSHDFRFRAPMVESVASKDVFFAGSDAKARFIDELEILRQWSDGDQVSTVYQIKVVTAAGSARLLLHEWHTVAGDQITSSVMIFDTGARATQLLREALMSHHG